jgi:Lon protease-like protein
MDLDTLRQSLDRLPIFPLPTAVLLPYEILPLHIFEPRYRELIEEVLKNERPLAIVQLAPGWEGAYEGRPAVEPICGVGYVTRHEKLGDGRYNILVRGLARVRIDREHDTGRSYREVEAHLIVDRHTDPVLLENASESLRRMLFALCSARPGPGASALAQLAAKAPSPAALADIVVAALVTDHPRRQRALVTDSVAERLELAQGAIAELLVGGPAPTEARFRN